MEVTNVVISPYETFPVIVDTTTYTKMALMTLE